MKSKESEKGDKYFDLARELKKTMKVTVIPFVSGALGTVPKGLVRGPRRVRNRMMIRDHPNYCIVKIC